MVATLPWLTGRSDRHLEDDANPRPVFGVGVDLDHLADLDAAESDIGTQVETDDAR